MTAAHTPSQKPVSVPTLRRMKQDGVPIVALTGYDASFAHVLDAAGVDGDMGEAQTRRRRRRGDAGRTRLAGILIIRAVADDRSKALIARCGAILEADLR